LGYDPARNTLAGFSRGVARVIIPASVDHDRSAPRMKNRVGLFFVECDGSIEDLDVKTAIPDDELSLWGAAIRDAIHHAGHGLRMPPAAARGRNAARHQFRRDLNASSSNFLIVV